MKCRLQSFFLFALLICVGSATTDAQTLPQSDINIDSAVRKHVIDTVIIELEKAYVFPEVADSMAKDVRDRLARGEYDSLTSGRAFAQRLTEHLQALSKDKHLRVRFSAAPIPEQRADRGPTAEEIAARERNLRSINFGFEKLERLRGNIGYVELLGFSDHELGAETVRAAMGFLANTDAIIFDLRRNGGGSPLMVALISSYLFGDRPVHLNSLYFRVGDRTEEFWTKPTSVPFKFPDKPVYVLTSGYTFSAGEEFTYNLRNLGRATVIGETTGGGAHPGGTIRLHDHFDAFIPMGRAISPITRTNWEGTGVEPHIRVPKEEALLTAHISALKKLHSSASSDSQKQMLSNLIGTIQKELEDLKKRNS